MHPPHGTVPHLHWCLEDMANIPRDVAWANLFFHAKQKAQVHNGPSQRRILVYALKTHFQNGWFMIGIWYCMIWHSMTWTEMTMCAMISEGKGRGWCLFENKGSFCRATSDQLLMFDHWKLIEPNKTRLSLPWSSVYLQSCTNPIHQENWGRNPIRFEVSPDVTMIVMSWLLFELNMAQPFWTSLLWTQIWKQGSPPSRGLKDSPSWMGKKGEDLFKTPQRGKVQCSSAMLNHGLQARYGCFQK